MKMKRILTLLLALLLALSPLLLPSCGVLSQVSGLIDELEDLTFGTSDLPTTDGLTVETGEKQQTDKTTPEKTPAVTETPEETETQATPETPDKTETPPPAIDENGVYTSKDDVALYIHTYGHLPSNFITKKEAQALGWSSGSLEKYAPGKSIGGDHFGNFEGLLPKKKGRSYTECDIDTMGAKSRGAKRIVFSNDGLIYYTDDHYETFTLLYGEEK